MQQSGEWQTKLHFNSPRDFFFGRSSAFKIHLSLGFLWYCMFQERSESPVLKMMLLFLPELSLLSTYYYAPPPLHHPQTYDPAAAVLHVRSLLGPGALLPLSPDSSQEQKHETGWQQELFLIVLDN